jgi:hypothetical protein
MVLVVDVFFPSSHPHPDGVTNFTPQHQANPPNCPRTIIFILRQPPLLNMPDAAVPTKSQASRTAAKRQPQTSSTKKNTKPNLSGTHYIGACQECNRPVASALWGHSLGPTDKNIIQGRGFKYTVDFDAPLNAGGPKSWPTTNLPKCWGLGGLSSNDNKRGGNLVACKTYSPPTF